MQIVTANLMVNISLTRIRGKIIVKEEEYFQHFQHFSLANQSKKWIY